MPSRESGIQSFERESPVADYRHFVWGSLSGRPPLLFRYFTLELGRCGLGV